MCLVERTDLVEVEGEFAGYGAVETSFEESGPVLRQDVLAAVVLLADAGHPRVNVLAAVDVLHGRFAEEEVHVVPNVVRPHEIRFCNKQTNKQTNKQINKQTRLGNKRRAGIDPLLASIFV